MIDRKKNDLASNRISLALSCCHSYSSSTFEKRIQQNHTNNLSPCMSFNHRTASFCLTQFDIFLEEPPHGIFSLLFSTNLFKLQTQAGFYKYTASHYFLCVCLCLQILLHMHMFFSKQLGLSICLLYREMFSRILVDKDFTSIYRLSSRGK